MMRKDEKEKGYKRGMRKVRKEEKRYKIWMRKDKKEKKRNNRRMRKDEKVEKEHKKWTRKDEKQGKGYKKWMSNHWYCSRQLSQRYRVWIRYLTKWSWRGGTAQWQYCSVHILNLRDRRGEPPSRWGTKEERRF